MKALSPKKKEALSLLFPAFGFEPSPKQEAFLRSKHKRRLIRSGNQTGKTFSSCHEVWGLATGVHPWRKVPTKPTIGLIVVADFTAAKQVVGKKLWETAPKHLLKPGCDWNEGRGWKHQQIELINGSVIYIRSSRQGEIALAGLTVDWAWIDEPPTKTQWSEILQRIGVKQGMLFLSMTPVGRPVGWLREHIEGVPEEGKPPSEEFEQFRISLSVEDCPHRSQESINAQLAGVLEAERPQREHGEWDGVETDRATECFDPDTMIVDYSLEQLAPSNVNVYFAVGVDYGEKKHRQATMLFAYFPGESPNHSRPGYDGLIMAFDEHVNQEATTIAEDATNVKELLAKHGLVPGDIDVWIGDINSAGKMAKGRKCNDELGAELNVKFKNADKASVSDHVYNVNMAMKHGVYKVHERCRRYIKSLKYWKADAKTEDLKHLIDVGHYVVPRVYQKHFKSVHKSRYIRVRKAGL